MKRRVLVVFGTRPEAIKMAPLVKVLASESVFETRVCVTAQHRGMLDQVLELFSIIPDYDLDVMSPNQSLSSLTSKILTGLENVFSDWRPDLILVHGDTTTTFVSSLAAFYWNIKVAHVEAGLRTGDMKSPWPEEANRVLTSVLADYHFAPTEQAFENLRLEGVSADRIFVTGNTVVDSLYAVIEMTRSDPSMIRVLCGRFPFLNFQNENDVVLITGHRRESFGDGFESICRAIRELAHLHPEVEWVYPVHLNPKVKEPVYRILDHHPNIHLIEPLDYLPFIYLMSQALFIMTDSGGIQEEAPSLGKPVLVLREKSERPEAIKAGTVMLVGTDTEKIVQNANELLKKGELFQQMSEAHNPYGDGRACMRIVDVLKLI